MALLAQITADHGLDSRVVAALVMDRLEINPPAPLRMRAELGKLVGFKIEDASLPATAIPVAVTFPQ
jgi:hypothetical protein